MKKLLKRRIALYLMTAVTLLTGSVVTQADPLVGAGLAIGQHAPAFLLTDQSGTNVSLATLLKQGPVALVFVRSASWCSVCKLRVLQLQRNLKAIEASGGHLAGISFDSAEAIKKFADREKVAFPMLSDAGSKTIDAYGMRNQESGDGSAIHGIIIIDQNAIVRSKVFLTSREDSEVVAELTSALKAASSVK